MTRRPIEIAKGYLQASPDDAQQNFTLWLIAEDAVELRYDASGGKRVIQADVIAGYEITEAIKKKTGCEVVKLDYARSRLTWSGGIRPLTSPSGPLKTKRIRPPTRTIRSS